MQIKHTGYLGGHMKRLILITLGIVLILNTPVAAQQASQNIPVLPVITEAGDDLWYLKGDGYLQRQVEPTIAVSTRNPGHLLSFFVDYRAVDVADDIGLGEETQTLALTAKAVNMMLVGLISLPELPFLEAPPIAAAEAWVGGSRSYDGGLTWNGFFMPGAPANFYDGSGVAPSAETQQMPIYGLDTPADPVAVAGPCGYVYVVFMAFTRGDESKMVVAQCKDLNNQEGGDTWEFQGMTVVESGNNATNGFFLDKPSIALDIFRDSTDYSTYASNFSDYECGHRVYISYSTFNGLESDGKFRSKINFAVSEDATQTWTKSKIQQPYNQNQGSALAVDPTSGDVYLVWRHFFIPDAVLMVKTTNYGKKFSKPVDLTADSTMYPYDQPTIATTSVHPQTGDPAFPFSDLTFRSNSFPTAAVAADGNGGSTIFVAWQELVSLASADFGYPSETGSPRIVLTRSDDGGNTWTGPGTGPAPNDLYWPTRRAVDFADRDQPCFGGTYFEDPCVPQPGFGALPDDRPSGPQVMPWLSVGGGKMALAYHESRGLLGGVSPFDPGQYDLHDVGIQYADLTGWGFISGLDRLVDFRVALLDPVTGYAEGTSQVSRYPISADADLADGEHVDDVSAILPFACGLPDAPDEYCQPRLDFKNKPQSASGSAAFQGDYPGMSPISQFVFDGYVWKWATSESDVPYSGFHVVFADNRNLVPATTGHQFEEWRYSEYDPDNCINVGSRNTDVLTAQINAELMVSAPTTYKSLENAVNSFPFTIRNGTAATRIFDLALSGDTDEASFSFDIDHPGAVDIGTVTVYPFSSVSQVVYISDSASGPVSVDITEVGGLGQTASITFNAGFSNFDDYTGEEIDNPFVRNPFVRNPFVRNSSSTNTSLSNPFVRNPFVRNPFVRNTAVGDVEVIDTTWEVEPEAGSTTASTYYPVININNAALFAENYAFQLIIWKQSGFGGAGADGCQTASISQDQILSNILPESGEEPFVLNPSVSNPFVRNENPDNPFVRNPFVRNPFVRNSAFTMAPSDLKPNTAESKQAMAKFSTNSPDDVTLAASPNPKGVNITLRAHRLKKYCDETSADLSDCLQKPLCRDDENSIDDLCVTGITECLPDELPGTNGCVVPNVFNPRKDPPSNSVGSERCFMKIVTDEDSVLTYDQRIALAEEECFKSPAPDLVPRVFTNPSGSAEAGGTLPFPAGWQVYNRGMGAATAENRPLRSGFYLSTDNVLDFDEVTPGQLDQLKGDTLLIGVESGGTGTTLASKTALTYSKVVDVPIPPWDELPTLPDGETNYHLILYVDDLLEVSEKNEINNFYSAVFALEILVPNSPPVAISDEFTQVFEDTLFAGELTATDDDVDDVLSFSEVDEPGNGNLTLNADGTFTYISDLNFNGPDSFTFRVSDDEDFSNIATVTITVNAVNDAPSFTKGDNQLVDEDAAAQTVSDWATAISAGPENESDQTLAFTVTNNNNDLFSTKPAIDGSGTLTFALGQDKFGTAIVSVTLSDTGGTDNSGVDTSGPQVFEITFFEANDPPVVTGVEIGEVLEDTPAVGQVVVSDPDNTTFTCVFDCCLTPGYLVWNTNPPDGWFTYTPALNYDESDSFEVTVTDNTLGTSVTVTITISAVDDPPTANPDSLTVDQNSGATPINVLLNDFDVDGNTVSLVSVTQPSHGSVAPAGGGVVTYSPVLNYVGADSFTYVIGDGTGRTASAIVSVAVVDLVPDWGFVGLLSPWKSNYSMTLGSVLPMKWFYTEGDVYVESSIANPRIDVYRLENCNGGPELFLAYSEDYGSGSDDWQGVSDWHYNLDTDRPAFDQGCYDIWVTSQYTSQSDGPFRLRLK